MASDILEQLADDVKRDVIATCARVAEIHKKKIGGVGSPGYEEDVGYNNAVRDIAAKIRQLL